MARRSLLALAVGSLCAGACSSAHFRAGDGGAGGGEPSMVGGHTGAGGSGTGAGGATATGTGGSPGSGGMTGTGGVIGTGGASGTGGATGAGGAIGTGGAAGVGGMGTGGVGTGGMVGAGGIIDAGVDVPTGTTPMMPGNLVITEIMADSNGVSDDVGEWFELYNPSTTITYDLFNCTLQDSSSTNQDTINAHVLVPPQKFATLARFNDVSGGFRPDFDYRTNPIAANNVKFSNTGGDILILRCGTNNVVIDTVNFMSANWLSAGAVPHGRTYSLDPNHYSSTDNDLPANWCTGVDIYNPAGPDYGSPGITNPTCSTCTLPGCTF